MADHGRYDQTREREGARYGRGRDESGFWNRGNEAGQDWGRGNDADSDWERGSGSNRGWFSSGEERSGRQQGQGRDDHHRSGGMFSPGRSGDEDDRHSRGGMGGHTGGYMRDDQRRAEGAGGRDFGYDDRHEGLPIEETGRLIASNKVEGTAVYARDGGRLGSIYNFMVDKRSGKVEYAVMSYGGFLGMGTRYYPLPWDILSYDTRLGGYHVDMLERDLERAPSFDRSDEPSFDTSYGRRVRGWYGLGHR